MADKMMRMAGRASDGTAKALKTDNAGNLGINLNSSPSMELINTESTLGVGGVVNATAFANTVLSKTAYVYAEKDGYAGIEVKLNNKWIPLLAARSEMVRDDFVGADVPLPVDKWSLTRHGIYNTDLSYAKILSDKLNLGVRSNSSYSTSIVTTKDKVPFPGGFLAEFIVDETIFVAGSAAEFTFGAVPEMFVDGATTSLAGRIFLVRITGGVLKNVGTAEATHTLPTLSPAARYVVEYTMTSVKIYREGVLVINNPHTFTPVNNHLYFSLVGNTSAGTLLTKIDSFIVWNKNADAKVYGKKPWIRSTTDVIPSEMRVVFQNDFVENNKVTVVLVGQA